MSFVCKMDENWYIKKCSDGYDVVQFGYDETCLSWKSGKKSFTDSEETCKSSGGNLVHVNSEADQAALNPWLKKKYDNYLESNPEEVIIGSYIGLTDMNSDPRSPQMEWLYGSTPGYTNWVFAEPDLTEKDNPCNTCAYIKTAEADPNWETSKCWNQKHFICQSATGNACPTGWTFVPNSSGGKCMNFYLSGPWHQPWYESYQYCKSIGARMLLIEDAQEQKFLANYFNEWGRAGITRMWLRYSDISNQYPKPNEYCDWSTTTGYDQWGADQPVCRTETNSCGYFSTSATSSNWATDNCGIPEAFACEVAPGTMIHAIEKPVNDHHCPEDKDSAISPWTLNPATNNCYLFAPDLGGTKWGNFSTADAFCKEKRSRLTNVLSFEENSWISARMAGYSWLDMELSGDGTTVPTKWRDGTPIEYANWREGAPWKSDPPQLGVKIIANKNDPQYDGQWANADIENTNNMIVCKQPALSGPVVPPSDLPDVPPHSNCDAGWHYSADDNKCFYLDPYERAWDIAESNCLTLGGHLASSNSPTQNQFLYMLAAADPTASGKYIYNIDRTYNCSHDHLI